MTETQITINDNNQNQNTNSLNKASYLVYNTMSSFSESDRSWLTSNFAVGINLYKRYQDLLSVESHSQEWQALSTINNNIALIQLTEERSEWASNTARRSYSRRNNYIYDENNALIVKNGLLPKQIKTIKKVEIGEGDSKKEIEIYSEYIPEVLDFFPEPIDLTNVTLNDTLNLIPTIQSRESEYARTRRFSNWLELNIGCDNISSFSCLGNSLSRETFLQEAGNAKRKVLKINGLYRGGNGIPELETVEMRPQRIQKGATVFPYLTKVLVLNQETKSAEYKIFFCLGIFDDLNKVIKYKRSRDFIPKLIKKLTKYNGMEIFDNTAYKNFIKQKYGEHIPYWNGISTIWEELPEDSTPKEVSFENPINQAHFSYITYNSDLASSKEAAKFKRIENAWSELKSKRENLQTQINSCSRGKERQSRRLEDARRRLKEIQTDFEITEKDLKDYTTSLEGYKEAWKQIDKDYQTEANAYKNFVEKKINNLKENSEISKSAFLDNLNKSGVIIDDILYRVGEDVISLKQNPQLALEKNANLEQVNFHTTKPVVIRVDPARYDDETKVKKIVGGPYGVTVTSRGALSIKLISSKACFGYQKSTSSEGYVTAWVHPHTPQLTLNCRSTWSAFTDTLVNNSVNGCLGEASPAIYNAFKSNDPKSVIYAAMTWITCANSSDQWGKNWKHFPPLSAVCLEGKNISLDEENLVTDIENLVTSEEGMDHLAEIASNLIESLNQSPEIAATENQADFTETNNLTINPPADPTELALAELRATEAYTAMLQTNYQQNQEDYTDQDDYGNYTEEEHHLRNAGRRDYVPISALRELRQLNQTPLGQEEPEALLISNFPENDLQDIEGHFAEQNFLNLENEFYFHEIEQQENVHDGIEDPSNWLTNHQRIINAMPSREFFQGSTIHIDEEQNFFWLSDYLIANNETIIETDTNQLDISPNFWITT